MFLPIKKKKKAFLYDICRGTRGGHVQMLGRGGSKGPGWERQYQGEILF